MPDDKQPLLPLDERFRQAEQYAFDLEEVSQQQPNAEGSCPYHKAFIYECPYCNPR